MSKIPFSPFSKRHNDALRAKRIRPSIPQRLRRRLWLIMSEHNPTYYYHPTPGDNWTEQTTTLDDLPSELKKTHGEQKLEAFVGDERKEVDLEGFVMGAYPSQVFDVLELFSRGPLDRPADFQAEVNQAFQDEKCPWLLHDGLFFQLDSQFLETHVLQRAHELLTASKFEGALDEFTEARNDLTAGDHKGAILNAGKAFESVMKAILGRHDGNASALVNDLKSTGFYTGIPPHVVPGFGAQVLMTLPNLRNTLAGHGQGASVVQVPRSVAELAVHLAGAFIVFLVKRHLELTGQDKPAASEAEPPPPAAGSEIPF